MEISRRESLQFIITTPNCLDWVYDQMSWCFFFAGLTPSVPNARWSTWNGYHITLHLTGTNTCSLLSRMNNRTFTTAEQQQQQQRGPEEALRLTALSLIPTPPRMCLHLKLFWQELVNGPAGCCLHTYPESPAACKSDSQRNKRS